MWRRIIAAVLWAAVCLGQSRLPQFEDYPVREVWRGPIAPPKLVTRSERMFRTQFKEAAKGPPRFAGRFAVAAWRCGTECIAGGFVDLKTGAVHPPPKSSGTSGWGRWIYCGQMYEGNGFEVRLDSRLVILRCGWNPDNQDRNHPDVWYFVWEGDRFRLLRYIKAPPKWKATIE